LVFNVITVYAPQIGLNESVKRQFWEELNALVSSVPISEKLFIGGDINEHVCSTIVGFNGVHGCFGYGSRNQEGEGILNFILACDLIVANTLFRKRVSHLVNFSNSQHCSQIDFILTRKKDRHACLDCKMIPGECVVPQHKLMVACFRFRIHLQCIRYVLAFSIIVFLQEILCIFSPSCTCIYLGIWLSDEYK
jgi:hypothetical protein